MGNKTSTPQLRVVAQKQKYVLLEHIPQESIFHFIIAETLQHTIHSVYIEIGGEVFVKHFKEHTKQVTVDLLGLADFPLFLLDPKKDSPSITFMVSIEADAPLDLKISPKFREVSPEEYSMIRHTDIQIAAGSKKPMTLVFKAKEKEGGLVIRGQV